MAKIVGAHTAGTIGNVLPFTGAIAPAGTLSCDGSAVSRTTYAQLFALIGTTHGQGDGSTTFNLPDYRGRFHRGTDGSAGTDPDKASRTSMNPGGNTGNTVGSVQGHQVNAHNHQQDVVDPISGFTIRNNPYLVGQSSVNNANIAFEGGTNYGNTGFITVHLKTPTLFNTGGNETRPSNAYVNYCICYN